MVRRISEPSTVSLPDSFPGAPLEGGPKRLVPWQPCGRMGSLTDEVEQLITVDDGNLYEHGFENWIFKVLWVSNSFKLFCIAGHRDVPPLQHGQSMSFLATQHEEMVEINELIDWSISLFPESLWWIYISLQQCDIAVPGSWRIWGETTWRLWRICRWRNQTHNLRLYIRFPADHKNGWNSRWSYFGPRDTESRYCYMFCLKVRELNKKHKHITVAHVLLFLLKISQSYTSYTSAFVTVTLRCQLAARCRDTGDRLMGLGSGSRNWELGLGPTKRESRSLLLLIWCC